MSWNGFNWCDQMINALSRFPSLLWGGIKGGGALLALGLAGLLASCASDMQTQSGNLQFPGHAETHAAIAPEDFMGRIKALADDAFEGRGPGTARGEAAADWIAAEMTRIGLKPGNNGSFKHLAAGARIAADDSDGTLTRRRVRLELTRGAENPCRSNGNSYREFGFQVCVGKTANPIRTEQPAHDWDRPISAWSIAAPCEPSSVRTSCARWPAGHE